MNTSEKKKPVYVGFASLKGGVGKSSLAEVIASYLYYERDIRLLVVDCDYGQYSFFKLREREREAVLEGSSALQERIQKHFKRLGRASYRVIKSTAEQALLDVTQASREHLEAYDLVIFDLPGRASDVALIELSLAMDYIISPIEPDRQSMVASMAYALTMQELGAKHEGARLRQLYLLWNKVDRRTSQALIDFYSEEIAEHQLGLFRTRLPRSVRFSRELGDRNSREVFRSTYLAPDKSLLAGSGIEEVCEEIISYFNLKEQA